MIDMHIHIVPGIDDGARTAEEARRMLLQAADGGTTGMIVTPHCNIEGYFENFESPRLEAAFQNFFELARKTVPDMKIGFGQEVYGTMEAPELIMEGRLRTLHNSRYVLMEFPFDSSLGYMTEILMRTSEYGFVPVVAHPERYDVIQEVPWRVEDWVDAGLCIQVNKGSILGRFGSRPYYAAEYLLQHGLVHLSASDAHRTNTRTAYLNELRSVLSRDYGRAITRMMLEDNPNRIWNNEELLLPKDLY